MGDKPKMATAEDFLSAVANQEELLYVPAIDRSVKLRPLTVEQVQDAMAAATKDGKLDEMSFGWRLFALGVVEPAFTDEQREQLKQSHVGAYSAIVMRLQAICGLDEKENASAAKSFPA